jgi:hypothetical protein
MNTTSSRKLAELCERRGSALATPSDLDVRAATEALPARMLQELPQYALSKTR